MHTLVQANFTFLTVILFELADVFVQELVRIFVVFCLQLEKLRSKKQQRLFLQDCKITFYLVPPPQKKRSSHHNSNSHG